MGKDSYWFKHDSNAGRDLKLMQIKAIYGLEGLGIYWSIIEVLREQDGYFWDEKEVSVLSKIIDCDQNRLSGFLADCKRIKLLTFYNSKFYSERLKRDMVIWDGKKANGAKGGVAKSKRNLSGFVANDVANTKRTVKLNRSIREEKSIEEYIPTLEVHAEGVKKGSQKKENVPLAEAAAAFDFSAYPDLKETALKFVAFAEKELHEVMTMKYPLTIEQICSILQKYTDRGAITSVLRDMENHAKLKKSYVSAYKTLGSWMEVRERNKVNV